MGDTALSILSGENFEILCIQHNCSHGAAYGMEQGLGVGGVLFSIEGQGNWSLPQGMYPHKL